MSTDPQTSIVPQAGPAPDGPRPREGIELPAIVLSAVQRRTVELLARGESVMAVAEVVGVNRGTIYRWRNSDPNFIATLNRWRGELQAETRDRVLALSAGAVESVAKSVAEGDSKLGLRVLEKMGCLKPGPDSPIDPYAVFGVGLEDESERGPVSEGFRVLTHCMTREQCRQAPELLALGVAIDNRRAGRATPVAILKMAGPLPEEMMRGEEPGECLVDSASHPQSSDRNRAERAPSSAEGPPHTGPVTKAVVRIGTHVVRRVEYR